MLLHLEKLDHFYACGATTPPQRVCHLRRISSRCSGVIFSQRLFIIQPRGPILGPMRGPRNKIQLSTSNPNACKYVIACKPKIAGINQFHNPCTANASSGSTINSITNILATKKNPRRINSPFQKLSRLIYLLLRPPQCKNFLSQCA